MSLKNLLKQIDTKKQKLPEFKSEVQYLRGKRSEVVI